jgi:UDPglucose 6-dehydrogenase
MKTVGIVGQGFVGGSLAQVLAERGTRVLTFDKAGKNGKGAIPVERLDWLVQGYPGVPKPRIVFVCLPTPMLSDGRCDVSVVEGALEEIASVPAADVVAVVKSTVPPGSCDAWEKRFGARGVHVVFNPEFLREATALEDMRHQRRIVLGGLRPWINEVKRFYEQAFLDVPIVKTTATTAEMVKYVTNVHLAVKVSLANELHQVCEALDAAGGNVDYDRVVDIATADERLGATHWRVPGPMTASDTGEPAFGFAGSCFPKDLNALMAVARSLGVDPKVMAGAWAKNLEVRPQRDWEKLVGRAVSGSRDPL